MKLKIQGDNIGLCKTCRWSHIMKTARGDLIRCQKGEDFYIPARVEECSEYYNKAQPALWDMEKIAWVLVTDKQRGIGFKPNKKWRAENPDEELVP